MSKHLVFLDTETTGLDPEEHEVWEVAFATIDGPIRSSFVQHSVAGADPKALDLNGYRTRYTEPASPSERWGRALAELALHGLLGGATIVGANPAFDAAFLSARWGAAPWHYRLLDIGTFAIPALGADRPLGLVSIADHLGIPHDADHTAAGDVNTLREAYRALVEIYDKDNL